MATVGIREAEDRLTGPKAPVGGYDASSAGSARAILFLGEASEGAVEAPSE